MESNGLTLQRAHAPNRENTMQHTPLRLLSLAATKYSEFSFARFRDYRIKRVLCVFESLVISTEI